MKRKLDNDTLRILIDKHQRWLQDNNSGSQLKLRDIDLAGCDLHGCVMAQAQLTNVDLTDADLTEVRLENANLKRVCFVGAKLVKAVLTDAVIEESDLSKAILIDAKLPGIRARDCWMQEAIFDGADLYKAEFLRSNFGSASIKNVRLLKTSLYNCDFRNADLTDVELTKGYFDKTDLRAANVRGAKLNKTLFVGCKVQGLHGEPIDVTGLHAVDNDWSENGDGTDVHNDLPFVSDLSQEEKMAVYILRSDGDTYDSLVMSKSVVESEVFDKFIGKRLADSWTPVPVSIYKAKKSGDFPDLSSHVPVFSEKALKILEPLIADSIEALPLKCKSPLAVPKSLEDSSKADKAKLKPKEIPLYAINVLELVDCLDYEQSEIKRFSDGGIMEIRRYIFKKGCLQDRHIFKSIDDPVGSVLVSEEFKRLVEENGLQGLEFKRADG